MDRTAQAPRPEVARRAVDYAQLVLPLRSDPPGTPIQRGAIDERHAWHLRQVIQAATAIGSRVLGIEDPLEADIERTPEREQRFQLAIQPISRTGAKQTGDLTPEQFTEWVAAELFGLGPLERFLARDEISEVMVNGPYVIFIEREGKIVETGHKFLDDAHVERIIRRIVRPIGRTIDADHPLVDARLADGSRVNAAVAPCTLDGPSLTIRKFQKSRLALSDLVRSGSLTEDMATFLGAIVEARQNIIVSGGTGSGKTTLINALSEFVPSGERVVTIEDSAELKLVQRNVVRLETKKATLDHPVSVTIRDCLTNALRMRPERILIGECRGPEALDMLQAMNTGHDGSMTTVHANNPRDAVSRLETLALMGGVELPLMVIRKQIASAVQFIVQASRMRDGSRRVTHITEVQRMEGDVVVLSDIFTWDERPGRDGRVEARHRPTGNRPKCMPELTQIGKTFPPSFFGGGGPAPAGAVARPTSPGSDGIPMGLRRG